MVLVLNVKNTKFGSGNNLKINFLTFFTKKSNIDFIGPFLGRLIFGIFYFEKITLKYLKNQSTLECFYTFWSKKSKLQSQKLDFIGQD